MHEEQKKVFVEKFGSMEGFREHFIRIICDYKIIHREKCILNAVHLGGDIDTIVAAVGELEGLAYGFEAISKNCIDQLQEKGTQEYLPKIPKNNIMNKE